MADGGDVVVDVSVGVGLWVQIDVMPALGVINKLMGSAGGEYRQAGLKTPKKNLNSV